MKSSTQSHRNFTEIYHAFKSKPEENFGLQMRQLISRKLSDEYEYRFDVPERICQFIEVLPDTSRLGHNMVLFDYQIYTIYELFGTYHKGTDRRRYTRAIQFIGRKNGKTMGSAILALYLAFLDTKDSVNVANLATAARQAAVLFKAAHKTVKSAPNIFESRLGIKALRTEIRRDEYSQSLKYYPSSTSTMDGLMDIKGIFLDEIAALKDPMLYTVLRSTLGATPNQLFLSFSSASQYQGIGYELYQEGCRILSGDLELDHVLPIIFALDKDDNIYDESKWIKSTPVFHNPDHPIAILKLNDLRQTAKEAKSSKHIRDEYVTKHLGMWKSGASNYFNTEKLRMAKPRKPTKSITYGGLDLSLRYDLSVFATVQPQDDGYIVDYKAWLPYETIQVSDTLQAWAEKGYITATEGDVIDKDQIAEYIINYSKNNNLQAVIYDRAQSYGVVRALDDAGIVSEEFAFGCTRCNSPMTEMARAIEDMKLYINPDPLVLSNFENCEVMTDIHNHVRPIKRGKGYTEKIDVVVAIMLGIAPLVLPNKDKAIPPVSKKAFKSLMRLNRV